MDTLSQKLALLKINLANLTFVIALILEKVYENRHIGITIIAWRGGSLRLRKPHDR